MKKIIALILLFVMLAPMALAEDAPVVSPDGVINTVIPTVLTRDIQLKGKKADGSVPNNPVIPGISPTTGLPKAEGRYVVVLSQIDNNLGALPQWGLTSADIMYELPISGNGWTRLTALFSDKVPAEVGPVRSARVMHAELREEWDALLLHYGEQTADGSNFREAIRNFGVPAKGLEMDGIGNKYSALFPRVKYHRAPHNVSGHAQELLAQVPDPNYPFQPRPFLFDANATYEGPDAHKITVTHKKNSSTEATYFYDEAKGVYLRLTAKGIYTDYLEPDTTLYYSNIIVQRTKLAFNKRSQNPLLPDIVGSGAADIFIGGKYIAGGWYRSSFQSRTVFYDQNGEEIILRPGKTWITINGEDTVVTYDNKHDANTQAYYAVMGKLPQYTLLQLGDSGEEVRKMKQALYEQGFIRTGKFNSRFQDNTVPLVEAFEAAKGLPVDGIADSLMLAILYGETVPGYTQPAAPEGEEPLTVTETVTQPEDTTQVVEEAPVVTEAPATPVPTAVPTVEPTVAPTAEPTVAPTAEPTQEATQEPAEEAATPEPAGERKATVVTGNKGPLNVRKEPKGTAKLLMRIDFGTEVIVLAEEGDWSKIRVGTREGYAMTKFLVYID